MTVSCHIFDSGKPRLFFRWASAYCVRLYTVTSNTAVEVKISVLAVGIRRCESYTSLQHHTLRKSYPRAINKWMVVFCSSSPALSSSHVIIITTTLLLLPLSSLLLLASILYYYLLLLYIVNHMLFFSSFFS